MRLRDVILEAYNNACLNDELTRVEINGWTPVRFAEDLFDKDGDIERGAWTVEEIAEEIEKMRREKLFV